MDIRELELEVLYGTAVSSKEFTISISRPFCVPSRTPSTAQESIAAARSKQN
jgi:hypothetical protein